MSGSIRKLRQVVARDGWLRTGERLWAHAFGWIGAWQLSHTLGRLRNLWRLPGARRRYLGGRLNLGCGPDWREGWLNADLGLTGDIHLDASRRFPFPDNFFTMIFSEHMLEHLPEPAAEVCLRECQRVLQPGGVLHVSTPDLAQAVRKYLAPLEETEADRTTAAEVTNWKYPRELPTPAQWLNDGFYLWEHRHLYDEQDLTQALQRAGFVDIRRCGTSDEGAEPAARMESRIDDSLVVEARKT
ncbi:MAG: class I SAM-dependent methyltransferase [Armatimonadota bacterium]